MKTDNSVVFLRGKKTILRPIEESDLDLLVKWINDREVTRFLKARRPILRSAEKKWLESLAEKDSDVVLLVCTKDGVPIGVMGLHHINWMDGTATTGAFIGNKRYWGKGYGTDAKMQMLDFAFNTLNLRKLCSKVYSFNGRSLAYTKKCGYRQEGVLKKHIFRDGEYHDVLEFALFKEDWLPLWRKHSRTA